MRANFNDGCVEELRAGQKVEFGGGVEAVHAQSVTEIHWRKRLINALEEAPCSHVNASADDLVQARIQRR
jgi:hypothetical protein